MKVTNLQELPKISIVAAGARNVYKQVPISGEDGSPHFSFRVFTVGPGGCTPHHAHDFEHLNYVISGLGRLLNGAGETREMRAGDFALVLPGEVHQYQNASETEPFVIICAVPKEYE